MFSTDTRCSVQRMKSSGMSRGGSEEWGAAWRQSGWTEPTEKPRCSSCDMSRGCDGHKTVPTVCTELLPCLSQLFVVVSPAAAQSHCTQLFCCCCLLAVCSWRWTKSNVLWTVLMAVRLSSVSSHAWRCSNTTLPLSAASFQILWSFVSREAGQDVLF